MTKDNTTYSVDELFRPDPGMDRQQARLISAALQETSAPLHATGSRLSIAEASKLICQTMSKLRRSEETRPASLALAQTMPSAFANNPSISLMRCRLLLDLRRKSEAVAEANRLLAQRPENPKRSEEILRLMSAHGLVEKMKANRNQHDAIWGKPEPTFLEMLHKLAHRDLPRASDTGFITYLLDLRGQPHSERAAVARELAWWANVRSYCNYLYPLAVEGAKGNPPDDFILAYVAESLKCDDAAALQVLQPLVAEGRSLIVLQSHSGQRGLISLSLAKLGQPLSLVGRVQRDRGDANRDFNLSTLGPSMTLEFLKLAKLHRRGQRVTRILPDGHDGGEMRSIDLFGRSVPIGMGGSTLAWYGKAILVFAKTRWTGQGWGLEVVVGPDIALCADTGAANDAFAAFYAENLRALLQGPLCDLGGTGGFVVSLKRK